MDIEALKEQVRAATAMLLREECLELVELKMSASHNGLHLVFLVDKPEGGVTLDACARLNRSIGDLLESAAMIEQHYVVEVSSPGLDRNLKTRADFTRCIGKQVKFFLGAQLQGKLEWDAYVSAAGEESLEADAQGVSLTIPYALINKARLIM